MKTIFKPGDKKIYRKVVTPGDLATFHGENVHPVCSTFSLARDFEWASRLFFLEMKEDHEEGVGTFLSIEHKSPAFEKEEVIFTATVVKVHGQELTCTVQAQVGERIVAIGSTGQKMLSKKRLQELFTAPAQ
jgi:fluoroacetyl-CoA thioesterase